MSSRRVVITGMGAVTPYGVSVDLFWDSLIAGRSGITPITLFDSSQHNVHFGGQVQNFKPTDYLQPQHVKRMDRFAQLGMVACMEAWDSSGIDIDREDPYRISVVFGSGIGGLSELEQQNERLNSKGPSKVSAFTIPKLMVNAVAGNISIHFGAKGSSIAVSSACASATHAMGEALLHVRRNQADIVFTGGSEAALTPLALAAFASMKALSLRNDEPELASRPWDRDRDGFIMAEGAGAFIFEELEHAKKRGATIFAEVIGYGTTSDADHITQPKEDGEGAIAAMRMAMADAAISPEDVDYINAHGTSTPLGDVAETLAIKTVFGEAAKKVVVSSTKSAVGHTLGASGGVELCACINAIRNSVVPPTINLDNPSENCDLDYCPNTARDKKINIVLNNSFGFGGHNGCLLIKRF